MWGATPSHHCKLCLGEEFELGEGNKGKVKGVGGGGGLYDGLFLAGKRVSTKKKLVFTHHTFVHNVMTPLFFKY